MEAAARHVASVPGAAKLQLYKNNVDGKGRLVRFARELPDEPPHAVLGGDRRSDVVHGVPSVVTGSGRVGIVRRAMSRASSVAARRLHRGRGRTGDHAQAGIINTRDEPHADADRYRRPHVIIGDANLSETSTYLKLGTTSLVLDPIEEGPRYGFDSDGLALARPVHAV